MPCISSPKFLCHCCARVCGGGSACAPSQTATRSRTALSPLYVYTYIRDLMRHVLLLRIAHTISGQNSPKKLPPRLPSSIRDADRAATHYVHMARIRSPALYRTSGILVPLGCDTGGYWTRSAPNQEEGRRQEQRPRGRLRDLQCYVQMRSPWLRAGLICSAMYRGHLHLRDGAAYTAAGPEGAASDRVATGSRPGDEGGRCGMA